MDYQFKILVVEDDQKLAKTITNVLKLHNFDVCFANNGAVGIQKAFEYSPDLILCDIQMTPVDGYQVYHVLKESSMLDYVPFIYITGSSDLKDIRFGMDLGADDYFVKPFENDRLIKAIEKRLVKYRKLRESGKREFKAIFNLSPNGIFLFDGQVIFDANPAFISNLKLSKDKLTSYSIEQIMEPGSYSKIKEKLVHCTNGLEHSFNEKVRLRTTDDQIIEAIIYIAVYEKFSAYSLMLGLVTLNNNKSESGDVFISDFLRVLKRENIVITNSLGDRLAEVFTKHSVRIKDVDPQFFSQREYEVLCLSMEGLPIKTIADKLYISDRTVEKHRANLMEKTNSNNMIEVIIYALRNNLVKM